MTSDKQRRESMEAMARDLHGTDPQPSYGAITRAVNEAFPPGRGEKAVSKATVWRWLQDEAADEPEPEPAPEATTTTPDPEPVATAPDAAWDVQGFEPVTPVLGDEDGEADAEGTGDETEQETDSETEVQREGGAVLVTTREARGAVLSLVCVVDNRFQARGASPLEAWERNSVADAWAPIAAKWLSGPEAPLIVASVVTVSVFGPRVAEIKAAKAAAEPEAEPAREPARRRDVDTDDLMRRLTA